MIFQRTLKRPVVIHGIGLHSGKEAHLTIKPARPNLGVIFVRTDLPNNPEIAAHYKNIVNTQLATTLGRGKFTIGTVEHVLAALQGMGIDNAIVEIDGPEIPILDGSSGLFCEAMTRAGIETQLPSRPYLSLRRRVELKIDEKWAVAEPSSRLEIHATIDWDHPAIGYQEFHYIEGKTEFAELASARTFGFLRDVEALKRMGLARGGSLENAVVMDEAKVLNPDGLRFKDEFVRHKVLDALGDFKLAGIAIQAYFRLHRAGHQLHSQLLTEIFKDPDNFEIIDHTPVEEKRKPESLRAAIARAGFVASF
jgi:UDP-3-O-[3-hydroxymyristoyl] N-acetylglucosamine deacetylase